MTLPDPGLTAIDDRRLSADCGYCGFILGPQLVVDRQWLLVLDPECPTRVARSFDGPLTREDGGAGPSGLHLHSC